MTLVSFWHNFVFVSSTKAASSTIHHLTFPKADLVFYRPTFGKHLQIRQISAMTERVAGRHFSEMFSFGIIREPVSWMQSWFRFRKRAGLSAPSHDDYVNHIPASLTFSEFIEETVGANPKPFARLVPQSRYFRNPRGEVVVKYVATYENLSACAREISSYEPLSALYNIDRLVLNSTKNGTQESAESETADSGLLRKLRAFFEADFELHAVASRNELKTILPYAKHAAPSISLTPRERKENIVSRLLLHISLEQYNEALAWVSLLDAASCEESSIKQIIARIDSRAVCVRAAK